MILIRIESLVGRGIAARHWRELLPICLPSFLVATCSEASCGIGINCHKRPGGFFRGVRIKISRMLVNVSVNRLNSGGVQICVAKPQANPSPVQTYPSIDAARRVLLEFGIDEKDIDATLKLLPEVGR